MTKYGYALQTHYVYTDDGYILALHRINRKEQEHLRTYGPPILLQHGFADSSYCWVCRSSLSPAFVLADLGYDVWSGNIRGNSFSKRHIQYNPNGGEDFWRFSWDEMG